MKEEIICILDGSGSMAGTASDAVGGFNEFLTEQKEVGEANLTIIWFDDGYEIAYEGKLSKAQPLTKWKIGGMTALHDAIGKTFSHVKDRFSKERPDKVVMAILTDGLENASREFTKDRVASLIKEHEEKYGWNVVYLAANQDAMAVGGGLNINPQFTATYDQSNTKAGLRNYSSAVVSARTS